MNKDLAEICLRYLDGELTADELLAFGRLLVDSPEAADLLAQLALDEQHYRATPAEAEGDLLPELLKLEEAALPLPHDIPAYADAGEPVERSGTYHGTLAILGDPGFWGYVTRSAMRSKPGKWAAAAAVVLLAVTLVFVFAGGNDDAASPPLAEEDTTPASPAETLNTPTRPTVATITATENAQWSKQSAELALARGSELRAGQTLTLTAGFAEITTRSGAIAIIEAPATIELLDSNNALRLITGKLVGICETDASKGFLVRTPHMDITDLSTRFGVAVDKQTLAHVIEGQVMVDALDDRTNNSAILLNVGQTALATTAQAQPVLVEQSAIRFISDWDALSPPYLAGNIRYEPNQPNDLGTGAYERDQIIVFRELSNVRLDTPLTVTIAEPGSYDDMAKLSATLPADTAVDSYLVHLDPATNLDSGELTEKEVYRAEIRFTQPILGLVTTRKHLAQTHRHFAQPGTTFSDENGVGLEQSFNNKNIKDRITLSEDRLTLTFELYSGQATDQFRVLVAPEPETD